MRLETAIRTVTSKGEKAFIPYVMGETEGLINSRKSCRFSLNPERQRLKSVFRFRILSLTVQSFKKRDFAH